MKYKVFGGLLFVLGLLVYLTPRYLFPTCEYYGYKPMACSSTGISEMFLGLVAMASATGMFLSKSGVAWYWALSVFAVGLSVVAMPSAIGYCHSTAMPCNYGTIPVLRLLGGLMILLSLTGFVVLRKQNTR